MKSGHLVNKYIRGFTITEALITLLVFSFFLGVLMYTMAYGFRTFSLAVSRSDVTTEARRLVLFMENELRSSAYFSARVVRRGAGTVSRDGLCFVSISDWSKPSAYNQMEGRPNWDRYLLYYATTEQPSGRLVRMVLNPLDSSEVGSFPYPPFAENPDLFLLEEPGEYALPDLANYRVLASKVKSFSVNLLPTTQEVEVRTILRQNAIMTRRGDGNREGGTFELHYRLHPENTT